MSRRAYLIGGAVVLLIVAAFTVAAVLVSPAYMVGAICIGVPAGLCDPGVPDR